MKKAKGVAAFPGLTVMVIFGLILGGPIMIVVAFSQPQPTYILYGSPVSVNSTSTIIVESLNPSLIPQGAGFYMLTGMIAGGIVATSLFMASRIPEGPRRFLLLAVVLAAIGIGLLILAFYQPSPTFDERLPPTTTGTTGPTGLVVRLVAEPAGPNSYLLLGTVAGSFFTGALIILLRRNYKPITIHPIENSQ